MKKKISNGRIVIRELSTGVKTREELAIAILKAGKPSSLQIASIAINNARIEFGITIVSLGMGRYCMPEVPPPGVRWRSDGWQVQSGQPFGRWRAVDCQTQDQAILLRDQLIKKGVL